MRSSARASLSTGPRREPPRAPPDCPAEALPGIWRSRWRWSLARRRFARARTRPAPTPDACPSSDDRDIGALLAAVVRPGDHDAIAFGTTFEAERQERILRYRGSPMRGEHGFVVPGRGHVLEEPRRYPLAFGILALTGFHLMTHENLHFGHLAVDARANFHRIGHGNS